MAQLDELCYLTALPDELLLHIFAYVNTIDIFEMCHVHPKLQNLSYDKQLIRYMYLYAEFRFQKHHIDFVIKSVRRECVVSLNINSVYWMNKHILCKLISNLPALQYLFAADTQLNITDKSFLQSCKKVRNLKLLAISATTVIFYDTISFLPKTIEYLHIYMNSASYIDIFTIKNNDPGRIQHPSGWHYYCGYIKNLHLKELRIINKTLSFRGQPEVCKFLMSPTKEDKWNNIIMTFVSYQHDIHLQQCLKM